MINMSYSQDVDVLLIELSEAPIAYAEDDGEIILHYSQDAKLVLIEILDFQQHLSDKSMTELLAS
ncbi:DUF2283 domain-containing protein [Trichothermofontia sp.]